MMSSFVLRPLRSSVGIRSFATSQVSRSHIGSAPIFVPPEVKFETINLLRPRIIPKGRERINLTRLICVTGPKGAVDLEIADFVNLNQEAEKLSVTVEDRKNKIQKALWGTTRALINNGVIGVTEGHLTTLRLQGTGYRAMIEDVDGVQWVKMKIGKCDLQGLPIPKGVKVSIPNPVLVILESADKQKMNLFAGNLRNFHPPEPYKGKGIYMNGETIKLKNRKIK